jgi:hypothetical protein
MANQELADALNEELGRLKVHELHVVMKPEAPGGRTPTALNREVAPCRSIAPALAPADSPTRPHLLKSTLCGTLQSISYFGPDNHVHANSRPR